MKFQHKLCLRRFMFPRIFPERHENDTKKPWFQKIERGFNYSTNQATFVKIERGFETFYSRIIIV